MEISTNILNKYFPKGQLSIISTNLNHLSDLLAAEIARTLCTKEGNSVHLLSLHQSAKSFIKREKKNVNTGPPYLNIKSLWMTKSKI